MNEISQQLAAIIEKSPKVAFLGVGSPLRADDNVGNRLVALLEAKLKANPGQEFRFYQGESAPENFTGAIRDFSPEYLIVFDAAELGESPGMFSIIPPDKIDGASFASHVLPLKIICNYLSATTAGCRIIMVGIQPQSVAFGEYLSPAVKEAIENFVVGLKSMIG